MTNLFWLSDAEWAAIRPHLPMKHTGPERVDDRRVLSGIIHVLRSGCRWRDCPAEYGPPTTVYNRFNRWSGRGLWAQLLEALATVEGSQALMADSSLVKAHRSAAGAKRMARPVCKELVSGGLISLHKRIRPSGYPLAKMEIRASRSS